MSLNIPSANQVSQFISTTVYYLLYSISKQDISFEKYIQQILQCSYNNVTAPVILTSLLYVQRYCQKQRLIAPGSEYKIWTVALILADIQMNDAAYALKSWSQVTRISIPELIKLRRMFLETIHYDLNVSDVHYATWIQSLKEISQHVSICLYYKNVQTTTQFNTMHYQPLMRQPLPLSPASMYSVCSTGSIEHSPPTVYYQQPNGYLSHAPAGFTQIQTSNLPYYAKPIENRIQKMSNSLMYGNRIII
jgi:hypothetical protein